MAAIGLAPNRFIMILALAIFAVWFGFLGAEGAMAVLSDHWPVSVTMVFGSVVAGGTGEGGGAIAFPVFTKLLDIPAEQARVFSLAIQSVGMTAAALALIRRKVEVEWEVILWGSLGGAVGLVVSAHYLVPLVTSSAVRLTFTMMQVALGVVLLTMHHREKDGEGRWRAGGMGPRLLLLAAGAVGGSLSGLMGTGISLVLFSVMVIYCRISERIALPTAVILVAPNSLVGFATYAQMGAFDATVQSYWLAAVPVVALGAPVGAVICSKLDRLTIVRLVLVLIAIEFVTTFWAIPMTLRTTMTESALFVLFLLSYLGLEMLGRRYCLVSGRALKGG